MSSVDVDGCRIAFSVDGPADAPPLLLSNSLGTDGELWSLQIDSFARVFRVIRYDARGHGRSDAPRGEYSLDRLGRDALAVLDAAHASRADVCGISMGGQIALWLGVHAQERVGRLVVANTGARIGTIDLWEERIATVRRSGMRALADAVVCRWFSETFREQQPATIERFRSMVAGCPEDGYVGCCAALRDADLRDSLHLIGSETLVVVGTHDVATPPDAGEFIRDRVSGAELVALDAAHLSNIERADAFGAAVLDFLRR